MYVSRKVSLSSDYASCACWPCNMAAMVTLRATSFSGPMIDFLNCSGESWALRSCEGIAAYPVSSDGPCVSMILDNFRGKVCLAWAQVPTYCREVCEWQCMFVVLNESELDLCLLTVC